MSHDDRIAFGVALLIFAFSTSASEFEANGFPSGADFFPIGVWSQSPTNAAKYKGIGVNTLVGLDKGPTEQQLAALARDNMFAVTRQNDVGLKSPNARVITAWL